MKNREKMAMAGNLAMSSMTVLRCDALAAYGVFPSSEGEEELKFCRPNGLAEDEGFISLRAVQLLLAPSGKDVYRVMLEC